MQEFRCISVQFRVTISSSGERISPNKPRKVYCFPSTPRLIRIQIRRITHNEGYGIANVFTTLNRDMIQSPTTKMGLVRHRHPTLQSKSSRQTATHTSRCDRDMRDTRRRYDVGFFDCAGYQTSATSISQQRERQMLPVPDSRTSRIGTRTPASHPRQQWW